MAAVTGILTHEFQGRDYALHLTLGGIAKLQGRHGNDLGGLLSGKIEGVPPFGLMIEVLSVALQRGEQMPADEADDLADLMLTKNPQLVERLMVTAFPSIAGNGQGPGAEPTSSTSGRSSKTASRRA